jgi:hypothetical protein
MVFHVTVMLQLQGSAGADGDESLHWQAKAAGCEPHDRIHFEDASNNSPAQSISQHILFPATGLTYHTMFDRTMQAICISFGIQ